MPKNASDYIRDELAADFDAEAKKIVEKVNKRGYAITAQHVYQIRSNIRLNKGVQPAKPVKPNMHNEKPLADYVIEVLDRNPDGLNSQEIAAAVVAAGYESNSDNFHDKVLRNKLYDMVNTGKIVNVDRFKAGVLPRYSLSVAGKAIANVKRVAPHADAEAYALLRAAVVDFARAKNVADPEAFPDKLIEQRRALEAAQKQYLQFA